MSDDIQNSDEQVENEELVDPRDIKKDEVFVELKNALIDEKRLLGRFIDFNSQYTYFEYDEMGINMEEADEVLVRANKIRDKLLLNIEQKLLYIFENVESNTITNIITLKLDTKEYQYNVIIEVLNDGLNLEIV
ncbi:MAG: hypothetical protein U9O56_06875 [Campylobacterota bacterium]|nr:hypothetical protein [Campylobacterota bacterium]